MSRLLLALGLGLALTFGCSTPDNEEPDARATDLQEEPEEQQPDPTEPLLLNAQKTFDERQSLGDIDDAVALWEEVLAVADDDDHTAQLQALEGLAHAHYLAAQFHILQDPTNIDDAVAQRAAQGEELALEALELLSSPLAEALQRDDIDALTDLLDDLDDASHHALLFYSKLRHLRAQHSTTTARVQSSPITDALMQHLADTDPSLHHGAPHRYFGVRHIDRPFHRNPDESMEAFEQSLDAAPDYLWTYLLMAVTFYAFDGDESLFEERLQPILEIDEQDLEGPLEQTIVHQWARDLER